MSDDFNVSPSPFQVPEKSAKIAESPTATALDDPPHPFRFGLQALMLLMALCGVQFSLMSYLGVLPGLLTGLAVCFVVLGGLMFAAMLFWRGSGTPFMHRLDQLAIRLVVGIVALGIGSVVAGGGLAIYEQVAMWRRAARLHSELGITAHHQLIVDRNLAISGLVIDDVSLGGPFDLAGGQPSDVIVCRDGVARFYEMIEDNRGQEVGITVAAGADLQVLEKCVSRKLDVLVPK